MEVKPNGNRVYRFVHVTRAVRKIITFKENKGVYRDMFLLPTSYGHCFTIYVVTSVQITV